MSIRLRLMLIFTSLVAVILSAFSIYVYYSTVYIRKNAFYDRLWERTAIAYQLLQQNPQPDLSQIHPSIRNTYWTILPDEEIIVYDGSGQHFFINEYFDANIDYQPVLDAIKREGKYEGKMTERQMVGLKKKIDGISYYFIVSAFDKNGQRLLGNLRITLITSFISAIFIVLLVGWYFSRESFKPVERIIEAAGKIGEHDLNLRVPIPEGKNELVRLVNTINDSLDRLQKAFEVQKTFVANASHELRTPLTSLRGELEVALLKERTNEEYRQFLNVSYEEAKRITLLVNTLLLFAQTSSEQGIPVYLPIRMDELIMDVRQKMLTAYPDRHVEIRFSGDTPDERQLLVSGSENLLSVAFSNILDNALKYSHPNPVNIIIDPGRLLTLSFVDAGIGISLHDTQHIFEPFYRSKRSAGEVGFGLGLPLARQIIHLHGGTIYAESKINEGTIVRVTLPKSP